MVWVLSLKKCLVGWDCDREQEDAMPLLGDAAVLRVERRMLCF